jgi:hypothetical protein
VSALAERYQGKAKVIPINVEEPVVQPFLKKYNVRGTTTMVLLDRHAASNFRGWPGDQPVAQAPDSLVAAP